MLIHLQTVCPIQVFFTPTPTFSLTVLRVFYLMASALGPLPSCFLSDKVNCLWSNLVSVNFSSIYDLIHLRNEPNVLCCVLMTCSPIGLLLSFTLLFVNLLFLLWKHNSPTFLTSTWPELACSLSAHPVTCVLYCKCTVVRSSSSNTHRHHHSFLYCTLLHPLTVKPRKKPQT